MKFELESVRDNGHVVDYMRYTKDIKHHTLFVNVFKSCDEWFYCSTYNWVKNKLIYYKCDQWDGLISCVEMILKQRFHFF